MVGKTFAASVWCGIAVAGVAISISGCQGQKDDANSRFEALYTTEWKWREEQFADDEDSQKPISDHLPKVDPAVAGGAVCSTGRTCCRSSTPSTARGLSAASR